MRLRIVRRQVTGFVLLAAILAGCVPPIPTTVPPPSATASATPRPTDTITPTSCPQATPEPFWVEPLTSPTDQLSQVVEVHIGNAEQATIVTESGTFTGIPQAPGNLIRVEVTLLPDTAHHLEVAAKVRTVPGPGGCTYGGYTLRTTRDRNSSPLTIVQGQPAPRPASAPITVENVTRIEELTSLSPPARLVTDFVFRGDRELVSAGYDSNILVWSTESGALLRELGSTREGALVAAVSADGAWIATGGTAENPVLRLWNAETGEMRELGRLPSLPAGLAFSPGGTRLASGGGDDTVTVWDLSAGQPLLTLRGDVPLRLQSFRSLFWKDEETLIAAGSEAVYRWNTTSGETLERLSKPAESEFLVETAFGQDGERLAAAAQEEAAYLREPGADGWSRWPTPAGAVVTRLAFSPDGSLLAAGTDQGQLLIWEVATGQILVERSTPVGSTAAVRFSPGGLYIATGGWEGPIRLWGIP